MIYENLSLDEERALYGVCGAVIKNCRFDGPDDGESALKEARSIQVSGSFMNLRYPFWHVEDAKISDTTFIENCDLAFERSSVNAEIKGKIDSVKNPLEGNILADEIGEIILEENYCDASKTKIVCRGSDGQFQSSF